MKCLNGTYENESFNLFIKIELFPSIFFKENNFIDSS